MKLKDKKHSCENDQRIRTLVGVKIAYLRTLRGRIGLCWHAFPDFKQERSFSLQRYSHLLCSKQHIEMSERIGTDEVNRLNSFYQRYHDAEKEKIASDQLNLKVSVFAHLNAPSLCANA